MQSFSDYPLNTESKVNYSLFPTIYFFHVCLLYFILWPLLIWVQVLKLPQFSQVEKKSSWVSPAAY